MDKLNIELVVTDFNGVIYKNPTETDLWQNLGLELIKDELKELDVFQAAKYTKTGIKLKKLVLDYENGKIDYGEIFDIFNEEILSGLDIKYVNNYITKKYVKLGKKKINRNFLGVIKDIKNYGKKTAILSSGCHEGIEALLREVGAEYFDEIWANKIKTDENGVIDKFELKISDNNGCKKGKILEEMLDKKGIDECNTAYIGHGPEDKSALKIVGHPIIYGSPVDESLLEEFDHSAFVPKDEQELKRYILGLSS